MVVLLVLAAVVVLVVVVGVVARRRGLSALGAAAEELGLRELPDSRGPHRYHATGAVDQVPVDVAIHPIMLYRPEDGREVATDPQTAFSADGVDPALLVLVRPPGGHVTRRELPRAPRVTLGEEPFDEAFEVLGSPELEVVRHLTPDLRARLLALPDVAEARWEDGRFSVRLSGTHHDVEVLRDGMATAALAVTGRDPGT